MSDETTPARLNVILFTTTGSVNIDGLPLPPPASEGRIKVSIPYPAGERRRTVYRVSVISTETGAIARATMPYYVIDPGQTLTIAFSPENIVVGPLGSSDPFTFPEGQPTNREHVAQLTPAERAALLEWLEHPNGSLSMGRVTFEAVENGGLLVRTEPYRKDA